MKENSIKNEQSSIEEDITRVLKENEQLSIEVNSLKEKLDEISAINFPILN